MRWLVHRSASLLAALALAGAVACSHEAPNSTKLSPDDAVSLIEQQGYTAAAAQCLIDGATHQNVDIFTFLESDSATQHDLAVVKSVGAFCLEHYGSTDTSVPGTQTDTTMAPG
jgi:hypothetical protein